MQQLNTTKKNPKNIHTNILQLKQIHEATAAVKNLTKVKQEIQESTEAELQINGLAWMLP